MWDKSVVFIAFILHFVQSQCSEGRNCGITSIEFQVLSHISVNLTFIQFESATNRNCFGHIALFRASSHLRFLLICPYSNFLRGQPPLMKVNWAYRPISRLEPPVKRWLRTDNYRICRIAYDKRWLRTDNYRICPIVCDKSYDEGWLQA
jgi:hypothetical protein